MFTLTPTAFTVLDNLRPALRHKLMDALTRYYYKGIVPENLNPTEYALFTVVLENCAYAQKFGALADFETPAQATSQTKAEPDETGTAETNTTESEKPEIAPDDVTHGTRYDESPLTKALPTSEPPTLSDEKALTDNIIWHTRNNRRPTPDEMRMMGFTDELIDSLQSQSSGKWHAVVG